MVVIFFSQMVGADRFVHENDAATSDVTAQKTSLGFTFHCTSTPSFGTPGERSRVSVFLIACYSGQPIECQLSMQKNMTDMTRSELTWAAHSL